MPGTKGRSGGSVKGSRPNNGGSRKNAGAMVKSVSFADPVAQSIRVVCLSLYGKADKETVTRYVTNLALYDYQEWDKRQQENAEKALEGE